MPGAHAVAAPWLPAKYNRKEVLTLDRRALALTAITNLITCCASANNCQIVWAKNWRFTFCPFQSQPCRSSLESKFEPQGLASLAFVEKWE